MVFHSLEIEYRLVGNINKRGNPPALPGDSEGLTYASVKRVLGAAEVTTFFGSSGDTFPLSDGNPEKGWVKIYKATVGGSTRYFIANTGYEANSSGAVLFSWVDLLIDSAF